MQSARACMSKRDVLAVFQRLRAGRNEPSKNRMTGASEQASERARVRVRVARIGC